MRNNFPIVNVYKKRTIKSEVVTQLLYGDIFKKLGKKGIWLKIRNAKDNYKGFIKDRNFSNKHKSTHKISKLYSNLYSKPNIKNKVNKMLSFGSQINVSEKKSNFYKFDNFWIKKKDLKVINSKEKKIFNSINKFKNVKYKWGGKSFNGIDCSALVQIFFNFNNKFCPRDAKDQIRYFKKKIKLKSIKKNDLIFWKGHVAIVVSKYNLIHAYGPFKKVVTMPIHKTIDRIYKTANLKVIGIRRI